MLSLNLVTKNTNRRKRAYLLHMLRLLFISVLFSSSCFAQDTLLIEDGSIWFAKSSCSVDFRCFDNIDEFIEVNCTDSLTITSIELQENVFEGSKEFYTDCRAQKFADYLKGKHSIDVQKIIATPVMMDAQEMRSARLQRNFRTFVVVLGVPEESEI